MVHAHLDDCHLMFFSDTENGQWHTKFIVKISLGFQNIIFLAQNGSYHLLGAGLAYTSGNTDNRNAKCLAIAFSGLFQGLLGIFHQKIRACWIGQLLLA